MKKGKQFWLLVISCFVLVVATCFYLFHFGHRGLSDQSDDWSNFSTFISLFVNIISLLWLGFIAYQSLQNTEKFNENQEELRKLESMVYQLQVLPRLEISVTETPIANNYAWPNYPDMWCVENCAKGIARNVFFRFYIGSRVSKNILLNPIAGLRAIPLYWIRYCSKFELFYSDLDGSKFYMLLYEGNTSETKEISKQEYDSSKQLNEVGNRNPVSIAAANMMNNKIGLNTSNSQYLAELTVYGII